MQKKTLDLTVLVAMIGVLPRNCKATHELVLRCADEFRKDGGRKQVNARSMRSMAQAPGHNALASACGKRMAAFV
jgi:hypothetical protein